jgi:uncharacterized membrane protein SpoIIM required for sporulation
VLAIYIQHTVSLILVIVAHATIYEVCLILQPYSVYTSIPRIWRYDPRFNEHRPMVFQQHLIHYILENYFKGLMFLLGGRRLTHAPESLK